jgi:LysR family transcriptional activator of nhaA
MFSLGQELVNALEHQPAGRPLKLAVGLADVIPKPVARQLLQPALALEPPVRLICREDKSDRLLADLAARRTDVVLTDGPIGTAAPMQGFNHLLSESGVSFFGSRELAARFRRGFPQSLAEAPLLLPSGHTQMRRSLNLWLDARRIHPIVAGEFDDSALMFWFGQSGAGIFPAASVMDQRIQRELGVKLIGRAEEIRERFYAITLEQQVKHPAVAAIRDSAQRKMKE